MPYVNNKDFSEFPSEIQELAYAIAKLEAILTLSESMDINLDIAQDDVFLKNPNTLFLRSREIRDTANNLGSSLRDELKSNLDEKDIAVISQDIFSIKHDIIRGLDQLPK